MFVDTTRITDPYIYVWEKTVPQEKCKNIIDKFEQNIKDSEQGVTFRGVNLHVKNSKDIFIADHLDKWKEEDDLFFNAINESFLAYFKHLNDVSNYRYFTTNEKYKYLPVNDEIIDSGYQIQKTEPGKGYVWHNDFAFQNNLVRTLTFILYLNTVEEGWTQFHNGDQVAPVAGRVVIFPATWTYVHQGYPPKQTKYIMTGWLHAKPQKQQKNGET